MVSSSSGNNAATYSPFAEKVITPQPSIGSPAENQFFDFDLSSFSLEAGGGALAAGTGTGTGYSGTSPLAEAAAGNETSLHQKAANMQQQQQTGHSYDSAAAQGGHEEMQRLLNMEMDAMQASQLQLQLEQIHMQSPALFAAFSSNSSHGSTGTTTSSSSTIADRVQQILTPALLAQHHAAQQPATGPSMFYANGGNAAQGKHPNMLTPAQSSEMIPSMHPGIVSPMPFSSQHLSGNGGGGGGGGELSFNERGELVFTPLLSPMNTQPTSQFTSPQFEDPHQGNMNAHSVSTTQPIDPAAQLQAIQATQITLQRQLDELSRAQAMQQTQQAQQQQQQQQQQQVQHHTRMSPTTMQAGPRSHVPHNFQPGGQYYEPSSSSSVHTSPHQHPRTADSSAQATPNADYFSPLTSPALMPVNGQHPHHRAGAQRGTGSAARHGRMSEGMQQTISPALLPQVHGKSNVPMMQDGPNNGGGGDNSSQEWAQFLGQSAAEFASTPPIPEGSEPRSLVNSPSILMSGNHPLASSSSMSQGRSPGLGPHRSNTGKTRPSPMIKPTHRPNRSSMNGKGPMSVPASPLVAAFTSAPDPQLQQATRSAFLESTVSASGSTGSGSLSPVDLSAILMPPPPLPGQSTSQPVAPMTPAALMQMASAPQAGPSSSTGGKDGSRSAASSQTSSPVVPRGRKASVTKVSGRPVEIKPRAVRPKPAPETNEAGGNSVPAKNPTVTLQSLEGLRKSLADIKKSDKPRVIRPGSSTGTTTPRAEPQSNGNGKAAGAVATANPPPKATKTKDLDDNVPPEVRRSSHKAAEQKRRDSLKAGFDELRLLLPPINTEALDPESGEPIPGSSAPRLLPKSSLVPDDNPNKGVSKVALLKYSNEYIGRLHAKVSRRDNYIDLLKDAIVAIRSQSGLGVDEQIEELLGYCFEDEDEDEVPTGMLAASAAAATDGDDANGAGSTGSGSGDAEEAEVTATQLVDSSTLSGTQQRKVAKAKPSGSTSSTRRKASVSSSGDAKGLSRRASKSKLVTASNLDQHSANDIEMA